LAECFCLTDLRCKFVRRCIRDLHRKYNLCEYNTEINILHNNNTNSVSLCLKDVLFNDMHSLICSFFAKGTLDTNVSQKKKERKQQKETEWVYSWLLLWLTYQA
jgi:hypothetical protein